MAGARQARGARGSYTSAGYFDQPDLYIADVPAGSPQENLRDFNRKGYAGDFKSERPWRQPSPEPPISIERSAPQTVRRSRTAARGREDLGERLLRMAKREKREAILCAMLFVWILLLLASWGQKMVEGVRIQNDIAQLQARTAELSQENETISYKLAEAKNDEIIRTRAQNELGMIRPELAQTQSIYIQATDIKLPQTEAAEETKMELLDVLLGMLRLLHIGE